MANARKVARKPFHLMAKPTGPPEGLGLRRADAHSERLSRRMMVAGYRTPDLNLRC